MASKWERVFGFDPVAAGKRWSFGVEGRATIVTAPSGEMSLEFFRRNDSKTFETMLCRELTAYPSPGSDEKLKVWTALLVAATYVPPAALVVVRNWLGWDSIFDWYFLGLAAVVGLAVAVVLATFLGVHFINMNKRWENAIGRFSDPDMKFKMLGVRDCMHEYQKFIKWRRTMGYILVVLGLYFFAQFSLMMWAARASGAGWDAISIRNVLFAAAFLLIEAGVTGFYAALRSFWTSRREPTLQLCMMIVEENRNTINAQRSRPIS